MRRLIVLCLLLMLVPLTASAASPKAAHRAGTPDDGADYTGNNAGNTGWEMDYGDDEELDEKSEAEKARELEAKKRAEAQKKEQQQKNEDFFGNPVGGIDKSVSEEESDAAVKPHETRARTTH